MLQQLEIQNYAIIDQTQIDFTNRLNIITGETGAGKSILLGALGLIMGKRADMKVLYNTNKKCFVEAIFDISAYNLKKMFLDEDLDYADELIIRREISASGKSRAFVNDTPTTLNVLKIISEQLIDLHRQFDTLDIHQVSFQIRTLDALAGNQTLMQNYTQDYTTYQSSQSELKRLLEQQSQAEKEMDFLNFQLSELTELSLEDNEQEKKEEQLERLSATEDLKRVGKLLYHSLDESEESILNGVQKLLNEADSIKDVGTNLGELYDRLYSASEELRDIASNYLDVAEGAEFDPTLAEELQQRLDAIYKLQNKHRLNSVEELIALQGDLENRVNSFADLGGSIDALKVSISKQEAGLLKQAEQLSKKRARVSTVLTKECETILKGLSMPNAKLRVDIQKAEKPTPTGVDLVEFLFASNKGSAFSPIREVASGGEISRLTLAIKSLVADAITLPTLIFDEIDTGVSGEVARKMGEIFSKLSKKHQVISITHSPQIAAKANQHFYVFKEDLKDRTITSIKTLDKEERIFEIGKMLSGDPPSNAAIANADELIKEA